MAYLEFFGEFFLTEEYPWVLIASVPAPFKLSHALENPFEFFIAHEADYSGIWAVVKPLVAGFEMIDV